VDVTTVGGVAGHRMGEVLKQVELAAAPPNSLCWVLRCARSYSECFAYTSFKLDHDSSKKFERPGMCNNGLASGLFPRVPLFCTLLLLICPILVSTESLLPVPVSPTPFPTDVAFLRLVLALLYLTGGVP
jgi:hypothetical protein